MQGTEPFRFSLFCLSQVKVVDIDLDARKETGSFGVIKFSIWRKISTDCIVWQLCAMRSKPQYVNMYLSWFRIWFFFGDKSESSLNQKSQKSEAAGKEKSLIFIIKCGFFQKSCIFSTFLKNRKLWKMVLWNFWKINHMSRSSKKSRTLSKKTSFLASKNGKIKYNYLKICEKGLLRDSNPLLWIT